MSVNFLEAEAGQIFDVDFAVLPQLNIAACPYALSFMVILDGVIVKFKQLPMAELGDQKLELDLNYNQSPSDISELRSNDAKGSPICPSNPQLY